MIGIVLSNKRRTEGPSRMKTKLARAECDRGCEPCFLECAVAKFMLMGVLRESDRLLREQPPVTHPTWPQWRDQLSLAQDHIRELQLDVEHLDPTSRLSALAAAQRIESGSSLLH